MGDSIVLRLISVELKVLSENRERRKDKSMTVGRMVKWAVKRCASLSKKVRSRRRSEENKGLKQVF
jgi:hypothetical protein